MKKIIALLTISLMVILQSCSTKNIEHRKGNHHSNHMGKMQSFYVSWFRTHAVLYMTKNSWYSPELIKGNPWNKITGRGGFVYNFEENIRKTEQMLVWRPIQDSLFEIAYYERENYEMSWEVIDTIGMYESYRVNIKDHLKSFIPTGGYFGGRFPAPQPIHYRLEGEGFRLIR